MQLNGFHHLTAVTADAPGNHRFYTDSLGLRLVKKTVNQDDTSAYHLFYADGLGSPGTDITFFDWPVGRERRGTMASPTATAVPPSTSRTTRANASASSLTAAARPILGRRARFRPNTRSGALAPLPCRCRTSSQPTWC